MRPYSVRNLATPCRIKFKNSFDALKDEAPIIEKIRDRIDGHHAK